MSFHEPKPMTTRETAVVTQYIEKNGMDPAGWWESKNWVCVSPQNPVSPCIYTTEAGEDACIFCNEPNERK